MLKGVDIFLFDRSSHVGQEKVLIFLIGIQQPQELRISFKADGSHFCVSHTVKEFISFVLFQVCLCLEKALWTHFISSAKENDSSLLYKICLITILSFNTPFSAPDCQLLTADTGQMSPYCCQRLRLYFVMLSHQWEISRGKELCMFVWNV